jgi:hypothetical protein
VLIVAGLLLASDRQVQSWLTEAIVEYLGLDAELSIEVQGFVSSLSVTLAIAGVVVILGTAIWRASPQRPYRGADFVQATGKIVISFGASVAALPLVTMLFGVWAALVLSQVGFPTGGSVLLVPSFGLQLAGLMLTGAGSLRFAALQHRIQ